MMHGTMGRPREKRPVPGILAAIGFFLLVFGAASIGMGAAIVLSVGTFGTSRPAWNAADVAVHNNDGYLEEYARGPGRGWFVLGQVHCAPQKNCAR
jgi:hypothetical protein